MAAVVYVVDSWTEWRPYRNNPNASWRARTLPNGELEYHVSTLADGEFYDYVARFTPDEDPVIPCLPFETDFRADDHYSTTPPKTHSKPYKSGQHAQKRVKFSDEVELWD